MKGFQKLTLAAAIAAAPFAQAEMMSIDDAMLSEMTGQAGITIDADVQMTIDAIKYVDMDGDGAKGAISLVGIQVGEITSGALSGAARVRGITIDADGAKGLVIGIGEIGDTDASGIDISVAAVLINGGNADLNTYNAVSTANAAYLTVGTTYDYGDYTDGTVGTDVTTSYGTQNATYAGNNATSFAAVTLTGTYGDAGDVFDAAAAGDPTAITDLGILQADGSYDASNEAAYGAALTDVATLTAAGTDFASAGAGNIGGIVIEDFTNYLRDDLVSEYNGVFDMTLADQDGVRNSTEDGDDNGRFIRGEIVIAGTGTYTGDSATTGGLRVSGEFGGAIAKAAWVDNGGGEFGVNDLGFFNGVDTSGDGLADAIEGMKFSIDIDVVDWVASHDLVNSVDDSTITKGSAVAALHLSNMAIEGSIMMGDIFIGTEDGSQQTSLGGLLVKNIDMTGTDVYVYGH